jgi:hypothetical protein
LTDSKGLKCERLGLKETYHLSEIVIITAYSLVCYETERISNPTMARIVLRAFDADRSFDEFRLHSCHLVPCETRRLFFRQTSAAWSSSIDDVT